MRTPVAATMPNITMPAPPSTNEGTDATMCAIFGNRPSAMRITPPMAATKRDRTPVTVTSPTFCENDVYGNVLNTPPITVPRPSARRPRVRSSVESFLPVISASARNMPVDSTRVINITMHIEAMAPKWKVGMPKCSGVMTATQSASVMPAKLTLPNAMAMRVPITMPSSTAMLPIRPRPYFVSNRMITSTASAMPRPLRSP